MIEAKPIIANRFWILKQGDHKIGTLESTGSELQAHIKDPVGNFRTIPMSREDSDITFCPEFETTPPRENMVHGFDAGQRAFNTMWDIKRRLPLFTKTPRSKSWYAAGWYWVKQHRHWNLYAIPKLIVLDRYDFRGPFNNKEQAHDQPLP